MASQYFHTTGSPSLTLLCETDNCLRNQHHAECSRLISYIPELFLQLPGNTDILCDHISVPELSIHKGSFSEGYHNTRYGHDLSPDSLGSLYKTDDTCVLTELYLCKKRTSVADSWITCYRTYSLTIKSVGEMRNHIVKCIRHDVRIRIDSHKDLTLCSYEAKVKSIGLTTVLFKIYKSHSWILISYASHYL